MFTITLFINYPPQMVKTNYGYCFVEFVCYLAELESVKKISQKTLNDFH